VYGGNTVSAFDSINSTGWGPAANFLALTAADAVCLQETKRSAGEQADSAEETMRKAKWSLTLAPSKITAAGGLSAGVGIAARSHFGLGKSPVIPTGDDVRNRVKSAWFPSLIRGGFTLFSVYLVAGEPLTSPRNRAILEAVAQLIDCLDGQWVIAADWQCSPNALRESRWFEKVQGVLFHSNQPTCGPAGWITLWSPTGSPLS